MSYSSRVNLRIPRISELPDDNTNNAMQAIYNALHLLNSRFEEVATELSEPLTTTSPAESITFRSAWLPIIDDSIETGTVVSADTNGFKRGAVGSNNITQIFGVVLKERNSSGEALIGWPPGVIQLDNATDLGAIIYSDVNGSMTYDSAPADNWPVGQIIKEGYAILYPFMYK